MALIYDDNKQPFKGGMVRYENLNACKHWLTHFGNYKYLAFIRDNTNNAREKSQAVKEIGMAQKKMEWWTKHPNFSANTIAEPKRAIELQWEGKRIEPQDKLKDRVIIRTKE